MGASLGLACARPGASLSAPSEAPEYGPSTELPPLEPKALAKLTGEAAPVAPPTAPGASASSDAPPATAPLPRLPGTPELTSDGNYRLAGGGLEVVLGAMFGWQIRSMSLDGQSCLVPVELLGGVAAGGSSAVGAVSGGPRPEVEVAGGTLLVRAGAADGSFHSTKRYRLDAVRRALEVTYDFENTGTAPVTLSSDEYWRVPSDGSLSFAPIVRGITEPKGTLKLNVSQPVVWLTAPSTAGWATVVASEGWLATVSQSLLLVRAFTHVPHASGHPVNLRAEPASSSLATKTILEARITVQSAPIELAPGAKISFSTRWLVRRVPGSIAIKPGNPELLGFARGVMQ